MEDEFNEDPLAGAAALEHLTGPSRGTVTWLTGSAFDITLSANRFIRISEARPGKPRDDLIARLRDAPPRRRRRRRPPRARSRAGRASSYGSLGENDDSSKSVIIP